MTGSNGKNIVPEQKYFNIKVRDSYVVYIF